MIALIFAGIKTGWWNFHTNFIIGAISGLIKLIISIQPSKIIDFLNDVIASFDKGLIYYGEK